jgi:hypothetical protein
MERRAHPQWLAFEVEERLQASAACHRLASSITLEPGGAGLSLKLNIMGEGKTRVIASNAGSAHWAGEHRVLRQSSSTLPGPVPAQYSVCRVSCSENSSTFSGVRLSLHQVIALRAILIALLWRVGGNHYWSPPELRSLRLKLELQQQVKNVYQAAEAG